MMGLLTALVPILDRVLGKFIPDEDKRLEMVNELKRAIEQNSHELAMAAASVINTEAASKHWLAANWRPLTMLSFVAIVVNNYLFAPYLEAIFQWSVVLELPGGMWSLLTAGIGGYVISRGGEKIAETWAATKQVQALAPTSGPYPIPDNHPRNR